MKNLEPQLYSYKMTHVTGKAPRVYEDELVLPACKPDLRRNIKPGQWMAGWTSKSLDNSEKGKERLIYLALVDTKISIEEFHDRYDKKEPCVQKQTGKSCCDENCPPEEDCDDDAPVVICKEFYYFGDKNAFEVPSDTPRPKVPIAQDRYGWKTEGEAATCFINSVRDFVRQHTTKCVKSNNYL